MIIEFEEWLPDLPQPIGDTYVSNCLPGQVGYRSMSGPNIFSNALSGRCLGAISAVDESNNVFVFAGTTAKIESLGADKTWTDESIAGGYSTTTDENWSFLQWGDQVLAFNIDEDAQTFQLNVSSLFADLSGTPPRARHVAELKNFVVVGNTWDSTDGNVPYRVRWSGIGDETAWTVSATTQADYQDLNSGYGWINGIVALEYGVIFQERAITRMDYVGSPDIFQFQRVEEDRGAWVSGGISRKGSRIFYLSEDGFYLFQHSQSIPIGEGKVNKNFFADLNTSYKDRITSSVDPINPLVFWAYPSNNSINGDPDKMIVYNWHNQKWGTVETSVSYLLPTQTLGHTLETLDNVSSSIDTLPYSLDSRAWTGGSKTLSGFDANNKLNYFNGTALDAVIDTKEIQVGGRRSRITRVRPLGTNGTTTVQVGGRETTDSTVTYTDAVSLEADGSASVDANNRYHRFRLNISGGFTHSQGVEIPDDEIHDAGTR